MITTLKYESLDTYSLDMYHFGLEKGNISEQEKDILVSKRLYELRSDLIKAFEFILAKIEPLLDFMDQGMEEVIKLSQVTEETLRDI